MKNRTALFTGAVKLLFVVQLIILLFLRYQGSYHNFYINAYSFFSNPESFPYDLFLNNSLLFSGTIYYDLLKLLRVSRESDFVLFPVHVLLSCVNIGCFILILRKFSHSNDGLLPYFCLLPTLALGSLFAPNAQSALIYSHTGTPTQLAFTFILILMVYTLQHKPLLASAAALVSLGLAAKHAAFPVLVCITYAAFHVFGWRAVVRAYLCFAIALLATGAAVSSLILDPDTVARKIEAIDFILLRDQHEDALHLQPFSGFVKLALGLCFLAVATKVSRDASVKLFLRILFVLSLLALSLGGLYAFKFYLVAPEPVLILLSHIKAMFLMQLFSCIGLCVVMARSHFNFISKGLLLAAVFFGSFGGEKGEYLAIFLFIIGIIVQVVHGQKGLFFENFHIPIARRIHRVVDHSPVAASLLVALCFTIPASAFTLNNKLNSYAAPYEGRFTIANTSADYLAEVSKLRDCPDFNLLPIDRFYFSQFIATDSLQNLSNPYLTHFAKKSSYLGDPAHLYMEPGAQRIFFKRKNAMATLYDGSASFADQEAAWSYLISDPVIILSPVELLTEFLNTKTTIDNGSFRYVFTDGSPQKQRFLAQCLGV